MAHSKLRKAVIVLSVSLVGAFQTGSLLANMEQRTSMLHSTVLKNVEPTTDRRNVLSATAMALLTSLLGSSTACAAASNPQTILITGSNSGIGYEASKLLAQRGHTVILGCRTLEKAENAVERIRAEVSSGTLIPAECNLASLESIRSFAQDLKVPQLDVVCYNAGLALNAQGKDIQRTSDGFELTGRYDAMSSLTNWLFYLLC